MRKREGELFTALTPALALNMSTSTEICIMFFYMMPRHEWKRRHLAMQHESFIESFYNIRFLACIHI